MFKKSIIGGTLNISASVIIAEFFCRGLNIKQKYRVANIFRFRAVLLFQIYQFIHFKLIIN